MRRKNVMLAAKFDEKKLQSWPEPYILQPKINGRRSLVYFNKVGKPSIMSSEDHPILSLPSLLLQLEQLKLRNVVLDGELYNPALSFQQLCSIVGRSNSVHADEAKVKFYCFDVVNDKRQFLRISKLYNLILDHPHAHPNITRVPSFLSNDIYFYLETFLRQGYEGIIIRHPHGYYESLRSHFMMKLKPRKSNSFRITGFEEEISIHTEPKNSLGAFWLTTAHGESFKVGSGFTRKQRDDFWQMDPNRLLKSKVNIFYQELSERGVPIFPIFRHLEEPVEN